MINGECGDDDETDGDDGDGDADDDDDGDDDDDDADDDGDVRFFIGRCIYTHPHTKCVKSTKGMRRVSTTGSLTIGAPRGEAGAGPLVSS